jgi:hypothetical protein
VLALVVSPPGDVRPWSSPRFSGCLARSEHQRREERSC